MEKRSGLAMGRAAGAPFSAAALPAMAVRASRVRFDDVYAAHFEFVWRTVRGLSVGTMVATEDAAQDVWLTVARRLDDFKGQSSLRTWLYAIARNVVRNHQRQQRRKGALEPYDDAVQPGAVTADESAAHAVWRDVQCFMGSLSDSAREVFLCRFLLEMSAAEVAAALDRNVLSIYTQTRSLKRAFALWVNTHAEELP